ncbi:MAG: heparinase II/III domain-containing protein, partial [Candidatus Latescibacterota bacterium]
KGDRIRARFPSPRTNAWVNADYSLADLLRAAERAPEELLDITALALTVRFEHADPDMPIMLGFDDFEVTGHRPARFTIAEPKVQTLEEWDPAIALRHYRSGDALTLRGAFPNSSPDIVEMRVTRFDHPETVAETVQLVKAGNSWSLEKPLPLLPSRYPAGMYTAEITGKRGKETAARTAFIFLVVEDARFSDHPRLWFDRTGTGAFVTKVKMDRNAPYLNKLREEAKTAREKNSPDLPYDLNAFPATGWLKSFEPYRHRIATMPQAAFNNAVAWTVDRDPAAAEFARKVLLSLCAWPTWTHPWMAERGHEIYLYQWYTAWNLALVYDLVHDRLTEAERRTVREAFVRNLLKPAYRTYVELDQCTCNESNWITAVVGGALTAACAVLGEEGDTSDLEPYLSGCFLKLRAHMDTAFGGDSACLEGFGYASGTMWIYSAVLPIIERCLGVDLSGKMHRSYLEMFWAGDHGKKEYYTFGDARFGAPTSSAFPWLVEKYRDPELAWFLDLHPPAPNFVSYHTMLHSAEGVPRKEPELSGAKWFQKTGTVVFRSGNEPNPFVLTFRCGPFGNHQHLDQGTFLLADRGELLVTEQEYSDYYEDPFYQSNIIQPVGHNCLIVDHNPQSQRTGDHGDYVPGMTGHARITAFVGGANTAFAFGDLSSIYLGNVKRLRRGILWLRPRTALIVDLLETQRGESSLDALFHGPKLTGIQIGDEKGFTIGSGAATLFGRVVFPMNSSLRIDPDPVKLGKYTNEPITPLGRLTVSVETSVGKAMSAVFLSTDPQLVRHTTTQNGSILELLDGSRILLNDTGSEYAQSGIATDGILAAVFADGSFLLAGGTRCSVDGRTLFRSDVPVTVLKEGNIFRFSSEKSATVSIDAGKARTVLLDGVPVKRVKRDRATGLTTLQISAGQSAAEMKN